MLKWLRIEIVFIYFENTWFSECISSVFIIVMCIYILKYLLVSVEIDHILNLRYDLMIGFSPNKEKDYYTSNETQHLFHLSNYFYFLTYCILQENGEFV